MQQEELNMLFDLQIRLTSLIVLISLKDIKVILQNILLRHSNLFSTAKKIYLHTCEVDRAPNEIIKSYNTKRQTTPT